MRCGRFFRVVTVGRSAGVGDQSSAGGHAFCHLSAGARHTAPASPTPPALPGGPLGGQFPGSSLAGFNFDTARGREHTGECWAF